MVTRTGRWLVAALGMIALAVPASASALTGSAVRAEESSARLPAPTTAAQATSNQRSLAPTVKKAVEEGGGRELLEKTSSPDVRFDVLKYAGVKRSFAREEKGRVAKPAFTPGPSSAITNANAARVRARAAGCYGRPWYQSYMTVAGVTVAWTYVRENGWCGVPYRITWLGGPTFAEWAGVGFCKSSGGTNYTWDGSTQWVHMADWGTFGIWYPWGCAGYHGLKAVVRIAWNGYWDWYNDYGF